MDNIPVEILTKIILYCGRETIIYVLPCVNKKFRNVVECLKNTPSIIDKLILSTSSHESWLAGYSHAAPVHSEWPLSNWTIEEDNSIEYPTIYINKENLPIGDNLLLYQMAFKHMLLSGINCDKSYIPGDYNGKLRFIKLCQLHGFHPDEVK
jgi:hypothetical protein